MAVSLTPTVATPTNFIEYAKMLPEADMARTFVENMVAESDLMRAVTIKPAVNGKTAYLDIASLPATGFRNLNAAGNQAQGTFNLREEDTFFIDEYIFIDRAMIDRFKSNEPKYKQEKLKSISLAQLWTQKFIKGDNTSNPAEPNGMQVRCAITSTNLFNNSAASGGAALSLANLDIVYWSVNKPSHWLFPRGLMPYVDAAARNNTLVNQTLAYAEDDFGRRIIKYKGLPILFGYEPDDSPDLLPFSEVAAGGGGAVTSSIFCLSLRDGGVYGIEQTPISVIPEGMLPGLPQESTHIKWDWGIAREHPRSVSRLTSITAAAIVA